MIKINKSKPTFIVGLAVTLFAALNFSNSLLAQNNSNSGNDNIGNQQAHDANQQGGRGNTYNNRSRRTRTKQYHEDHHSSHPSTNCYGGKYDRSVCGNIDTMNNY